MLFLSNWSFIYAFAGEALLRIHKHKQQATLNKVSNSVPSKHHLNRRAITTFCQTQACLLLLKQLEEQLAKNHSGVYSGRW